MVAMKSIMTKYSLEFLLSASPAESAIFVLTLSAVVLVAG